MLMFLIGPFITSELNGDPISIGGGTVLAGHRPLRRSVRRVCQFIFVMPFFLGRQLLRSSADNEEILRVLVIAWLLYSLPILIEIRMSPQLHQLGLWISRGTLWPLQCVMMDFGPGYLWDMACSWHSLA